MFYRIMIPSGSTQHIADTEKRWKKHLTKDLKIFKKMHFERMPGGGGRGSVI